jgi:hypothetical protein
MKRLPKTPSRLIRLAIADFRRVLKLKKTYVVDMSVWHKPNNHCSVCLAGAVIAGTLGAKPDENLGPFDYSDATAEALAALDEFRAGYISDGLSRLDKADLSKTKTDIVENLEDTISNEIQQSMDNKDWRSFNRHMLRLADELEKIRL